MLVCRITLKINVNKQWLFVRHGFCAKCAGKANSRSPMTLKPHRSHCAYFFM
nr:MAG TPA_asm: hypothetical protein [Caudoviricetes sp.]